MLAPRILNEVSCETRINHEIHFAWQTFHVRRGSIMRFILRGRRSIW